MNENRNRFILVGYLIAILALLGLWVFWIYSAVQFALGI